MNTETEFLRLTSKHFHEAFKRLKQAIDQLDESQVWLRPASGSNSVGIILQHLIGNLNQWICAGIGGSGYQRNRPEEFKDQQHRSKDAIVKQFIDLGKEIEDIISKIPPDSLHSPRRIQDTDATVMSALYKAMTHFECHEGQVLYIAKLILNEKYTEIWGPRPKMAPG